MKVSKLFALIAGLATLSIVGSVAITSLAEDKKKDEDEVKVTIDQVPKEVKATLLKEVGGGKITEIEKETEDGKTVFSADAKIGDKEYDIKVAEDGKLISKEEEDKDEKKDEKGEKKD